MLSIHITSYYIITIEYNHNTLSFNSDDFSDLNKLNDLDNSTEQLKSVNAAVTAFYTALLISCCSFFWDRLIIIDIDVSSNITLVKFNLTD